jgi:hypothetical protein
MTSIVRRASGTRSPVDVLLRATWIRRRTTADDVRDYEDGVTLKVTCLLRKADAGAKGVPINGSLFMKKGDKVAWRPFADGAGLVAPGPLTVTAPAQRGVSGSSRVSSSAPEPGP